MTPESAVNPAFPVAAVERWQLWEVKARRRAKTEAPIVGDGENEGRPESRSRRSESAHGTIPGAGHRIGGDLVGRNRPDERFGEKESMVSLYGPRRRTSPKLSSVKEWWRMEQEGGAVEPTQVDARRGRFAVALR